MKKIYCLVALLALCSLPMWAGGSDDEDPWVPDETYAKWCREFQFDKVWQFADDGSAYNDASYPDNGVGTADCPGILCFSLMSWKDRSAGSDDYGLEWAEVYLYDEAAKKEHQICKITFTGDDGGSDNIENIYAKEGSVSSITNSNYNKTWCVQKRMNSSYGGNWGAQFCYFVTQYDQSLVSFVDSCTSGRLNLKIHCKWDNKEWKEYTEYGKLATQLAQSLMDPTLSVPSWNLIDGATSLNYSMTQMNQNAITSVILLDKNTKISKQVYHAGDTYQVGYVAVKELGQVTRQMVELDELAFTAQTSKTYAINQAHWKVIPSGSTPPSSMTSYSNKVETRAPQLVQPTNMRVENNGAGVNTLKWTMNKPSGSSYDQSAIVAERSLYSDFATIDASTTITYNPTKTEYSWDDKYKERNRGNMKYYYRIYRTVAAINEPSNTIDYTTPTNYVRITDMKVEEQKGQALVRWTLSGDGLWTEGMKLQLSYDNQKLIFPRDTTQATLTLKTCTPTLVTLTVLDNGVQTNPGWEETITLSDTIPSALHVTTSKGFYNDHVDIDWSIPADSANFSTFVITRMDWRDVGTSNNWTNIGTVSFSAGVLNYHYQDNTCVPGVYYVYRVTGISVCDKLTTEKAKDAAVGFAQPYGVVTGQVRYNTNQGVEGVKISALGETARKGRSLHLTSLDSVQVNALVETGDSTHWERKVGTKIQYKKPSGTNECWIRRDDAVDVPLFYHWDFQTYITASGQIKVYTRSSASKTYTTTRTCDFSGSYHHVAITYENTESSTYAVKIYVDGELFDTYNTNGLWYTDYAGYMYFGATDENYTMQPWTGEMDEIRMWGHALTADEIRERAHRHLSPEEQKDAELGYYFHRRPLTQQDYIWRSQPSYVELVAHEAGELLSPTHGCIEMWLKPESSSRDQVIMHEADALDWRITSDQQMQISSNDDNLTLSVDLKKNAYWDATQFNHIAFAYNADKGKLIMQLFVNGHPVAQKQLTGYSQVFGAYSNNALRLGEDGVSNYVGYMDEIRFWNIYRDSIAINKTLDCYLSGTEYGLTGYYRCDDENTGELYDISKTNSAFNCHHMKMVNALLDENNIPTSEQLSLATRTDVNGNYILNAVPYSAEGSLYTIVPTMGVHEFSPTNQPMFFDKSSSTHNSVNFIDNSSFEVSGYVYYENTNYPVSGCMFAVDDVTCTKDNKVVTTDDEGHYTISVPIGKHYMTITQEGHSFADGGRYPAAMENMVTTYDFQEPINDMNFTDITRVTLTGRVAGGEIQASLPHGMQQGTNNIGHARVVISPIAKGKYDLNLMDTTRIWSVPDNCQVESKATTGKPMTDAGRYIVIETDKQTGEFTVELPPINMSVDSISVASNPVIAQAISPAAYGTIELNDFREQSWHKDSLITDTGKAYFTYNKALDVIYRVSPYLEVRDTTRNDALFGLTETIGYDNIHDTTVVIPLIVYDSVAKAYQYQYGYPFLQQNNTYTLKFFCYEKYTNSDDPNAIQTDKVPVENSLVTVYNGAGDALSGSNNVVLNAKGEGTYIFMAGDPNIMPSDSLTQQYHRSFSISYTDSKQEAYYNWEMNKGASCIVLGAVNIDGQNFITEGPDELLYILRDPPGSKSFATLKKGTEVTRTYTTTTTTDNSGGGNIYMSFGPKIETGAGFGVISIITMDTYDELFIDPFGGQGTTEKNTTRTTFALNQEISTSTDEWFDGPSGDVYIGLSTNFNYGNVKYLGFTYDDIAKDYILSVTDKTAISKEYNTSFALSQYQLEKVQIPNMIRQRNELIMIVDHDTYVNYKTAVVQDKKEMRYISEIPSSDPHFGQAGYYIAIPPTESVGIDKVDFYNAQIERWKSVMAQNEKAKVMAIEQGKYNSHKNISVDGGSKYSSTSTTTHASSEITIDTDHFKLAVYDQFGFSLNRVGTNIKGGYEYSWQTEDEAERDTVNTEGIAYTFDLGTNEQLSVDIYEGADAFGPIYATSAGQTECPYEGEELTKYYEPGLHTISAATQKLADPVIEIDGSSTVSGVPVGGKAIYTVKLINNSPTTTFTILRFKQASGSNPWGAEIKVDGSPLTEEGIPMKINPQTTIVKTITLSQSNLDYLNYDNIGLIFCSDCSPVITADTTYISAHFVAACPEVELRVDRLVVNNEHPTLNLTVSGYDVTSPTLQSIRLEYKEVSDPLFRYQITTLDMAELKLNPQLTTYAWNMKDLLDGVYEVRATTVCQIGSEEIYGESETFTITKDVASPVALGLPSPVNGIYTNDNEIYVLMNEPIQTAKVIASNVSVTGMLNAHDVSNHKVAFHYTDSVTAYTESQMYISSKAFSLEMWLRYQKPGYVWYHGKMDGLWLSVNAKGYLVMGTPTDSVISKIQMPQNEWCYLLVSSQEKNDSLCTISMHLAYGNQDLKDEFTVLPYAKTAPVFVGITGEGDVHDMMMTPTVRSWETASMERNQSKDLHTDVIGYWPMNEGHGQTMKDQLRHRNLVLTGSSWWLKGTNYAKRITQPTTVPVNTLTTTNNYAIEFWFRMDGDGEVFRTTDNSYIISIHDGQYTAVIGQDTLTGKALVDAGDGTWHQMTFLGNKSGKAAYLMDGKRVELADANLLPNLMTKAFVFGANNPIEIDEFRAWQSDMSESWLELYRYSQLGEDAMDVYKDRLAAYESFNNIPDSVRATTAAPLREPRTQSTVSHTVTTSDQVVMINITEPAYRIEGCTLEFYVQGLIDENGNYSDPITWTAYVNRNQLLWSESEMAVLKENLDEASLMIDIVNNSGKTENWSISNQPEWLTFSETSGTIQPLSEYHLKATIDPSLAIGTYESVIYLTGSQSIKTPLYLNVKVTGDEPDWQINPADYEYSMNLIGVATLNGFAIDDEEDKVAAFVNGQLAGVTSPKYNKTYYQFFVMMDIYANLTQEQSINIQKGKQVDIPVTFKLWDASTGRVYTQLTTMVAGKESVINFAPNTLVGTVTQPVILAAGSKVEQTVALEKGWNWISFNVLDENVTLNEFLKAFISDITIIKSQTQYAQIDTVRGQLIGSLNTMDAIKSYHTNSNCATKDVVVGYPVNPMMAGIYLEANRWSWIGYIPQMSLSVNAALANLNPAVGDIVKGRKGFATWDGYQWVGSLSAMVPGQGYMYFNASATDQILYYPTTSAIADYSPIRRLTSYSASGLTSDSEAVFTPVDPGTYQNNMTITARVMDGEQIVTDAEVGVFAGEECRANAFASENLYFLTIPGEQSTPLTFKVARGGEIIVPEQSVTYMTDAVIGDIYAPYIIQIGEASGLIAPSPRGEGRGEVYKVLLNEHVYIIRNGKKTNILGYEQ